MKTKKGKYFRFNVQCSSDVWFLYHLFSPSGTHFLFFEFTQKGKQKKIFLWSAQHKREFMAVLFSWFSKKMHAINMEMIYCYLICSLVCRKRCTFLLSYHYINGQKLNVFHCILNEPFKICSNESTSNDDFPFKRNALSINVMFTLMFSFKKYQLN